MTGPGGGADPGPHGRRHGAPRRRDHRHDPPDHRHDPPDHRHDPPDHHHDTPARDGDRERALRRPDDRQDIPAPPDHRHDTPERAEDRQERPADDRQERPTWSDDRDDPPTARPGLPDGPPRSRHPVTSFFRANPQVLVLLIICLVLGIGTFLAVLFGLLTARSDQTTGEPSGAILGARAILAAVRGLIV